MLWLYLALLSALFTSLTTITIKLGLKNINSNFATFYRTGIVIISAVIMCFIVKGFNDIEHISITNIIFLVLSGIFTGLSWLAYFKALKIGSVNVVAPIDKSSFILTAILSLILFFPDTTNNGDIKTIIFLILSIIFMFIGTILLIEKKEDNNKNNKLCIVYALISMVFASLVYITIKLGLQGINSSLATLIRTIIVFIFAGCIVLFKRNKNKSDNKLNIKDLIFLTVSGLFTGAAWILEYSALAIDGVSIVAVNAIGKLSILLTMAFSFIVLKEKFSKKALLGLLLLTIGIIFIIL